MMRRLILMVAVGLLAAPGCGSHRQVVRPDPDAAANDRKVPQRVNNGESEAVKAWSTGGP